MDDLDLACRAAADAAAVILSWRERLDGADFKGEVNPVTAADREAEAAIASLLAEHRPDDGLLAEEGAAADTHSGRRWVVDPLDGTVNFLHGVPQVAVSIALEDGNGTALGVIHDIFRNEVFTAVRGEGAQRDGRPIAVSSCTDIGQALISTGFAYDRHTRAAEYTRHVAAVMTRAQGIRRAGSAAVDLAWVACGRYDGHWEFNLSPWDVAAGFLLVREAGGVILGFDGDPSHHGFAAGAPEITATLRDIVAAVR